MAIVVVLWHWQFVNTTSSLFYLCRCGEIGRRKGLKIPRSNIRTGSSPVIGTNVAARLWCATERESIGSPFSIASWFFAATPFLDRMAKWRDARCFANRGLKIHLVLALRLISIVIDVPRYSVASSAPCESGHRHQCCGSLVVRNRKGEHWLSLFYCFLTTHGRHIFS